MAVVTLREQRAKLAQQIEALPTEAVADLVKFVEYLQYKSGSPQTKRKKRKINLAAFGLWKDRSDIKDSADYSLELRRRIERRQDGAISS